ncbi:pilin protein [Mitsuokella sp.]|uniref:pilin protein n=1 Tax=Mitsuokella sp. TaxID=2049034 RepID=UPI003D7D049C
MLEIIEYLKARYMSEKAQGIVEYALILAFVTIIATALINSGGLKSSIMNVINNVGNLLNNGGAAT